MRWEGSVQTATTGDYQFQTYSDGNTKVWKADFRQMVSKLAGLGQHILADRVNQAALFGERNELFWRD